MAFPGGGRMVWWGKAEFSFGLANFHMPLRDPEKVMNRQIDRSVEFREMVQAGDINLGISADR